jgi:hypothetical protein
MLSALTGFEEGLEGVDVRIDPCLDSGEQLDVVEKRTLDGESLVLGTGQDDVVVDLLESAHERDQVGRVDCAPAGLPRPVELTRRAFDLDKLWRRTHTATASATGTDLRRRSVVTSLS